MVGRPAGRLIAATAAALGLALAALALPPAAREPASGFAAARPLPAEWQRGANLTAYSPDAYASQTATEQLGHLASIGVDHVAVIPLWYMDGAGSSAVAPDPVLTSTDPALEQVIGQARALGLRVAIAPHVDLRDGSFRGRIDPADRERWFATYGRLVDRYAELAARTGADELVLGTELETMSPDEPAWRALIAGARERYGGTITYAANWVDEAERIAFWDALDEIGVNAYMPLDTGSPTPTVAELTAAWEPWVERLRALHDRWGLPIAFTELGYQSREGAATAGGMPAAGPVSQQAQADAYEAAYRALAEPTWFRGIWWWDWSVDATDPDGGGFTPQGKLAEAVVAAHNRAGDDG